MLEPIHLFWISKKTNFATVSVKYKFGEGANLIHRHENIVDDIFTDHFDNIQAAKTASI